MKTLHIVPELNEANGVYVVARLLAREGGDAEVVDLSAVSGQSLAVSEGSESLGFVESLEEVWVHGMWLPREWAACRRVLKAGKRLVRMTHGSLSPVYLKRQSPFKKWLVGPIERYWLRKADRIVATCDAEKAWIEAYLGKKCPEIVVEDVKRFFDFSRKERKGRVEERGNFISRVERVEGDESVFNTEAQRHRGAEKDELHLLYLGRRHPLKGVEFLERAVKELVVSRQSLVVSEKDLTKSKLETSNTKPENRNIELKIVSNAFGDELEKVWDWCDVLVLPTLSENFGLVVAEALERGKRVITTDGAPAWGDGNDYGGCLVYLKGYRDGSEKERVRLLKDALMMMV